MEREKLEGLRVIYVASEILLYLWVFRTEAHDELVFPKHSHFLKSIYRGHMHRLTLQNVYPL